MRPFRHVIKEYFTTLNHLSPACLYSLAGLALPPPQSLISRGMKYVNALAFSIVPLDF